ncbi:MAG: flagellar hook-associated protein FlgL [Chloroflexi bacterium]|nr:flagellar hook-associated protein FlgL [Chloroflexota bacterium]
MRVTSQMMSNTVLNNLAQNVQRMEKYQAQMSSGKRLNNLSDDPVALVRALTLRSTMEQNDQYSRSIDSAKSWLNTTDVNLGAVNDLLIRATELATNGANDTIGSEQRHAIALEVRQLLENAVQVGNSTYEGRYIFAGFQTDTAPFTLAGDGSSVTYNGDHGAIPREIGSATTIQVNTDGEQALTPVFDVLIRLYQSLEADDTKGISDTLNSIDAAIDTVLSARAEVGARVNRLEGSDTQISEVQGYLADLLSKAEDTDMADVITKLATEQTLYQAALGAAAKTLQPSLIDFLR